MPEAVFGRGILVRLYVLVGIADGEADVVFWQYVVEVSLGQSVKDDVLVVRISCQSAYKRVRYDTLLHGLKLHFQIQVPFDGHTAGENSDILAFFLESIDPDSAAHVGGDDKNIYQHRFLGMSASFPEIVPAGCRYKDVQQKQHCKSQQTVYEIRDDSVNGDVVDTVQVEVDAGVEYQ